MRHVAFVILLAGCGPKVQTGPATFDEDLGPRQRAEPAALAPQPERQVAPVGKGLRTGTIERAKLLAVLDSGPATFLRQVEVAAHIENDRFVGWQLVQLLDHAGPLGDVDVAPGDVLLAINGRPLSRPDQLQAVWDSLRSANQLKADLWRGNGKVELAFTIEPAVQGATQALPPPPDPEPAPHTPASADRPKVQLVPKK
jgi:hypothetical protein